MAKPRVCEDKSKYTDRLGKGGNIVGENIHSLKKKVKATIWFQKLRRPETLGVLGYSSSVLSTYFMDAVPLTIVKM